MGDPSFLFESWRGRYADSPRVIHERLVPLLPGATMRWVRAEDSMPRGLLTVRRHRPAYFARLLTCDVLVANDIVSRHVVKGPRVRYVQTWHGTPLKLIGHDERAHAYAGASAHLRRMERDVAKWDHLVSPSPTCTRLFRSAFGYDGDVWETGYPRNDALLDSSAPAVRERVRREVGAGPETLVVLWAPTWRDDQKDDTGSFTVSTASTVLDAADLLRAAPRDSLLLSRMHKNVTRGPHLQGLPGVVDVSGHHDISELFLAADVLVSDYSSAIFDFAVTGKPIICFVPDLDAYRDDVRGMYFDYEEWAPGPLTRTSAETGELLRSLGDLRETYAARMVDFRAQFCPHEDGRSGQRVAERIMAVLGLGDPVR